jgi:hypothetical protein
MYTRAKVTSDGLLFGNPSPFGDNAFNRMIALSDSGSPTEIAFPDNTTLEKPAADGPWNLNAPGPGWTASWQEVNRVVNGHWNNPTMKLKPGEGYRIKAPTGTSFHLLLWGFVPQGNRTTSLLAGIRIYCPKVAKKGRLQADLGFPVQNGNIVKRWQNGAWSTYQYNGGTWTPSDPVMECSEAFFVYRTTGGTWSSDFTIW